MPGIHGAPTMDSPTSKLRMQGILCSERQREKKFLFVLLRAVIEILLIVGGIELNPVPFPCSLCSLIPETVASSVRHQQFHSQNVDFSFYCPLESCVYLTKSYGSLRYHVSVFHRETSHVDPAATDIIVCPHGSPNECCSYRTTSLWEFVQHLIYHIDKGESVVCPIDGCNFSSNFVKKSTFRVHLSQYHVNWRDEGCPKPRLKVVAPACSQPTIDDNIDEEDFFLPEQQYQFNESEKSEYLNDDLVYDIIAKFYLHLYAVDLLPVSTIQEISEDITSISEVVQGRLNLVLTSELKKLDVPDDKIKHVCHRLKCADPLFATHHKNYPGPSLTSDYLRKKYFAKHFGYVCPVEVNLNEDDPSSEEKYQYISPTLTLAKLFEDPTVQEEIDASFLRQHQDSSIISDYTSGARYLSENHPRKEIQLFIYQDSLNAVLNVLGSAKNKYKMLNMYFTIGNYQPHIRAREDTKYCVLIIRESVFKKVGKEKCFERVLAEFRRLEEEGMTYKGENVKVVVEFSLADALGQHTFGGFIECFSAEYFCRFCEILRKEFKKNPTLTKPQRTMQEYNRCVMKAQLTGQHCKGIKEDCAFNTLKYFHATSHLVPCVAHDACEGLISWDMAGIIGHFVSKKYFTYELLNRRIQGFRCLGGDAPNKPAFVPKKGEKLGGHAVQNWTLVRLFPFIIGDKIDFDDDGWQLYLLLKKLCEYIFAPALRKSDIPFFKDVLLPQYFDKRALVLDRKKYPLKPKHHYVNHYPELTLEDGSLVYLWTLSYEQKHKFFKHVMRMSKNFINPESTCAVRYQLKWCYMTSSGYHLPTGCEEISPSPLTHVQFKGELCNFLQGLHLELGCWRQSKGVCYNGLDYELDDLVLLSADESESVVQAGFIKVIATNTDGSLFFTLEVFEAKKNQEEGIFYLPSDCSGKYVWISAKTLKHPVSQAVYVHDQHRCFSLKHCLV